VKGLIPPAARDRLRGLVRAAGYVHGPRLMSWLRQRRVILANPHAHIRFGRDVHIGPGFSLHIPDNGTFEVGDRTEFRRGFRAEVSGDGRLTIGSDCHFTYYVLIQCSTVIDIGDHCQFGQSTIVLDGQHRFRDLSRPMLEQGYDFKHVKIDDHATVTTKCSIMADLGTRSFIGANAVVTKPIPPYTVAVGAPARPVDYFGPPGQEPEGLSPSAADTSS
jgi:acetyltransferase-like isoleucine patch superfamily enzyme